MSAEIQGNILVVDDVAANTVLIAAYLNAEGYEVRQASSGEAALAAVADDAPDLILLDALMPGMSGFDVVSELKARADTRNIPVVMVTALSEQEVRIKALECGAEECIVKPVHRVELLMRVRNLLKLKKSQDLLSRQGVALERAVAERTQMLEAANLRLSETQEKLIQSEKLASIGQLAAGVAHEINNPVGFVNSNLGTLQRYVGDFVALIKLYQDCESALPGESRALIAAKMKEVDFAYLAEDVGNLLEESLDGLSRVRRIVSDLKDFARANTSLTWEKSNVERCIDAALSIVYNEIKYKARVEKHYGGTPDIDCNPSQLSQVFLNMLVNASHAITQENGLGRIGINTGFDEESVFVEISDSGCGISEENLKRIFEPFFTTKPVGVGTGLGLSVSYGIIHRHHGRIDVESEVGAGTRFLITLPRVQLEAHEAAG